MWSSAWVLCETEEKGLKMSRLKSVENNESQAEHNDSDLSNTFAWLDGKKSDSIVVPLGDDEEFCSGEEEMSVESDIVEDVHHLELDEENNDYIKDMEVEDNGKVLPLFITHLLNCNQYHNSFKLGTLVFKTVKIFGTVVATQIMNRKNTLLVDDGTAQILCYMEDSVNNDVYNDICNESYSIDSPYYEFSKFYKKTMKECEYTLPSFDKINVGDRVLIVGNVSFYKDNFYIFIKLLNRPKENSSYVDFVERIFELFESYYNFGIDKPLESHLN